MEGLQEEYIATSLKGSTPLFKQALLEPAKVDGQGISASAFPKTRYYGSKLRLLEWISACVADLSYKTALDAFGGTATISLMFKLLGKSVTYNDILSSNHYIAKALLHQERAYNPYEVTSFFKNIEPIDGFITKTFEDYYYLNRENKWLDGATQAINRSRSLQKKADLFYCLYQACLQKRPFNLFHRKNLYIRQNCKKDTKFGNWRTWEKTFLELISTATIELDKAKKIKTGSAIILPPGDASNIKSNFDLVYIDPPYLKETGSGNNLTYLDRYHFLEGMADYNQWEKRLNTDKKNYPLHASTSITEWNSKVTFKDRLFDLIDQHKKSIVILSYSTNGFPNIDQITSHFKSTFTNVIILNKRLSHALKKRNDDEILIIGI